MNKFMALVRISLLAMLSAFRTPSARKKKRSVNGVAALAFMGGISLYVSVVYSMMFALQLDPVGKLKLLPFVMAIVGMSIAVLMTAFAAGGLLFGGKDSDMLLSLPVSAFEVLLSKTLALYIENLCLISFMLLPSCVIYMIYTKRFSPVFLLLYLVSTALLAFVSTLLTFVLGYIITVVTAKLKGSKLVANLLYLVMFGGIMVMAFQMNTLIPVFVNSVPEMSAVTGALYPLALFCRAVFGDIGALAVLALIAIVPFVIVVWLFSHGYKATLTRIGSVTTRSDYKLTHIENRSQFSALFKKEMGRFFGTPLYLFNTCFGLVMLLGGSVYAVFQRAKIHEMLAQMGGGGFSPEITVPIVAAAICFCIAVSCTTSISLSLEGKTIWILKEAPLSVRKIFGAKAALNLTLTIPVAAVSTLLLAIALSMSAADALVIFLLAASLSLFVTAFGLVINLLFPKLDAPNDVMVIKQSMAAMIPVFGSMIFIGLISTFYGLLLSRFLDFRNFAMIVTALLLILSVFMVRLLQGWGARKFREL
ncbi:MAG: hypothetical protein RR998_06695 [Oscillospiraceae bacterium]